MLKVLDRADGADDDAEQQPPPSTIAFTPLPKTFVNMITEDAGMVGEICMFLKNNVDSSLPTRFQPAFNATFQTIDVTVKDWGDDVKRDVGKMLGKVASAIFAVVPEPWMQFARAVPAAVVESNGKMTVMDASNGVFTSEEQLDRFLRVRVKYTLEIMSALTSGPGRVTEYDLAECIGFASGQLDAVMKVVNNGKWYSMKLKEMMDYDDGTLVRGDCERTVLELWAERWTHVMAPSGNPYDFLSKMGQVAEDMARLVGKVLRDDRDSNASPAKEPMLEAEAGAVPAAEGAAEAEAEAADTTTVENQFSYTPLAQMKAAWQIQLVDNVVVSPVVVNDIALKLETFLWEKAMLVSSKSVMKEMGSAR